MSGAIAVNGPVVASPVTGLISIGRYRWPVAAPAVSQIVVGAVREVAPSGVNSTSATAVGVPEIPACSRTVRMWTPVPIRGRSDSRVIC